MEEILLLRIYRAIVGVVGILGNGLVCLVIGKVPELHTRTNAFIFHQAVVDFLGSSMVILDSEIPVPKVLPDNDFGWFLCHIWLSYFLLFSIYATSTFNLLAVTLERYFAIVRPFKYQAAFARHPRLKVGLAIATCWIVGVATLSGGIFITDMRDGECQSIPGPKGLVIVFMLYVAPVTIMLFAYIRTSVELKRGAARVAPGSGQSTDMMESLLQARRNTFKTLLVVFVTFMICWTPNQMFILMFNLGYPMTLKEWYFFVSVALVASNSCVNPVIYAFKYRQFRTSLRKLFCRKRDRRDDVCYIRTATQPNNLA